MSTPVATIADALIAFILSLLRDPAAVEEFDAAPKAVLASNGLEDACAADVQGGQAGHRRPPSRDRQAGAARQPPSRRRPSRHGPGRGRQGDHADHQPVHDDRRPHDHRRPVHEPEHLDRGRRRDADLRPGSRRGFGRRRVAAGDDATLVDSEVDVTVGDVSVGNTDERRQLQQHGRSTATRRLAVDEALADRRPAEADAVGCRGDRRRRRGDRVDDADDTASTSDGGRRSRRRGAGRAAATTRWPPTSRPPTRYESDDASECRGGRGAVLEEPAEEQ